MERNSTDRSLVRRRQSGGFALGFVIILWCLPTFQTEATVVQTSMGGDSVRVGEICTFFIGELNTDEFFKDLKVLNGGREFRQNGRRVTDFPDQMNIEILAAVNPCANAERTPEDVIARVMNDIRFELYWKTKGRMRPIEKDKFIVSARPLTAEEWERVSPLRDVMPWKVQQAWHFDLTVLSTGVPLTDVLVTDVGPRDAKRMARLVLRLEPRPRTPPDNKSGKNPRSNPRL